MIRMAVHATRVEGHDHGRPEPADHGQAPFHCFILGGEAERAFRGAPALHARISVAEEDRLGAAKCLGVIRRLRPAVIVTFDPGGVYGHPDHVTCSTVATEAYRRAAAEPGGPVALYHQALSRSAVAGMRAAQEEERRRSGDTTPPTEDDIRQSQAFEKLARPDEEITTIVPISSVLERKIAALACHDSQMQGRRWEDPETRSQLEQMFGRETFMLSLIHISEPTRLGMTSYAVFCLKKK